MCFCEKNSTFVALKILHTQLAIKNILELIRLNSTIRYEQIEDNLGIDKSIIQCLIARLKENSYINKANSKVKGIWQLLDR